MGEQFSWFFDVAIIGVIIVCIYIGGKKGFLRTAVLLAGYLIAGLGGYFIAKEASPVVYTNFLQSKVENVVEDNLDNFSIKTQIKAMLSEKDFGVEIPDSEIDRIINQGGDVKENFANYAKQAGTTLEKSELDSKLSSVFNNNAVLAKLKDKVPASIYSQIEHYLNGSKESLSNIIKAMNNPSKEESAKEIADLAVKPIILLVLQVLIFMISFTLLMIIVKLVSRSMSIFNKVPVVGSANTLLGGVLGFVQGAFIVVIIVLLVKVIIALTSNELIVLNTPTIEETKIFKEIYNLKIFN